MKRLIAGLALVCVSVLAVGCVNTDEGSVGSITGVTTSGDLMRGTVTVCPEIDKVNSGDNYIAAIVVTGLTGDFDAFGLDLEYHNGSLDFVECNESGLTSGWTVFACSELTSPARIRMGGFNGTPVTIADPDTLGYIEFSRTSGCATRTFKVTNQVDDISAASDCSTTSFVCHETSL